MKHQLLFVLSLLSCVFLFSVPYAFAELTFSTNQSTYYVPINQPVTLAVDVQNPYGEEIRGRLTYSLDQRIIQQNQVFQQRDSQTQEFVLPANQQQIGFQLGQLPAPGEILLDLNFNYIDPDNEEWFTTLEGLQIVFFDPNEQQQQQQQQQNQQQQQQGQQQQQQQQQQNQDPGEPKESESKTASEQRQEQQDQAQREQEIREERQRRQQELQQQQNQLDNRMQNNQRHQDTNSLKQEIAEQAKEQQNTQQQFNDQVNEELAEQRQQLEEQGFEQKEFRSNPENESSGTFESTFEHPNGTQVKFEGEIQNNTLTDFSQTRSLTDKATEELVKNDPRFQELNQELQSKGYNQTGWSYQREENSTQVTIQYQNEQNETKEIIAQIEEEEVISVSLKRSTPWLWILVGIAGLLAALYCYKKFSVKKPEEKEEEKKEKKEKPRNYKKESLALLAQAKKEFAQKNYKEAYSLSSQSLRLYEGYKIGMTKELSMTELLKTMKKKKIDTKDVSEALEYCGLVEFAKYEANKKDFSFIVKVIEKRLK